MSYEVVVERVAAQPIAAAIRRVRPGEVARAWKPALDEVWAFLRARDGIWTGGHNVFLYQHPDRRGEPIDVAFGVEVSGTFEGQGEVVPAETPAGLVATTVHTGPYDRLSEAHVAIEEWCGRNGRLLGRASWESYGEATDDPAPVDVRVSYLLAE
jgi:effector-binding domain-containing protein